MCEQVYLHMRLDAASCAGLFFLRLSDVHCQNVTAAFIERARLYWCTTESRKSTGGLGHDHFQGTTPQDAGKIWLPEIRESCDVRSLRLSNQEFEMNASEEEARKQ